MSQSRTEALRSARANSHLESASNAKVHTVAAVTGFVPFEPLHPLFLRDYVQVVRMKYALIKFLLFLCYILTGAHRVPSQYRLAHLL
jgi:hypothetical protein